MVETTKRLLELTAADLMSRDVIAISQQTSLRSAAHQLALARVSGAPVVDENGRCVGVLSATDLVRWLDRGVDAARRTFTVRSDFSADWEVVDLEALPVDDIGRYMSTHLITATPDTGIGELAQAMLSAHIHRIIILAEQGQPIGIVSSSDVLAAVVAEDQRERQVNEGWANEP
jgi:CBS-domain-containing membrane protein